MGVRKLGRQTDRQTGNWIYGGKSFFGKQNWPSRKRIEKRARDCPETPEGALREFLRGKN